MKRKATTSLARLEPTKNWPYSQFSLYAVAGTEMMVTALISVARKERQAAHHGIRRRARKKSSVACCSRLKAPPMRTRAANDAARMAKSGHVSADPADSAMGSCHYGPQARDRRRTTSRLSAGAASAGRRMSRAEGDA